MTWFLLLLMAVITFFNRYIFLAKSIRVSPSPKLRRLLAYSSYSVLTAIWAPIVFQFDGQSQFSLAGGDYIIAASVAATLSFGRVSSLIVVLSSSALFFLIRLY